MTDGPEQAAQNTDREIWRRTPGDFYAPSILVTQDGAIGLSVGGQVIVRSVEEWHRMGHDYKTDETRAFTSQRHAYFQRRVFELGAADKDSDYNGMVGQCVLALSLEFAKQGHLGTSAEITLGLFNQLVSEYNAGGKSPQVERDPPIESPTTHAGHARTGTDDWRRERAAREASSAANQRVGASTLADPQAGGFRKSVPFDRPDPVPGFKRAQHEPGFSPMTPAGIDAALQSFDAMRWAQAFVQLHEANPSIASDAGTMVAWFANALMRGFDEATRRARKSGEVHALGGALPGIGSSNGHFPPPTSAPFPEPTNPLQVALAANEGLHDKLQRVRALECLRAEVNELINRAMDRELL